MPELPDSIEDDDEEVAIPPIIDPTHFEEFPAFREAFLLYVPDPKANATLRGLGALLYAMILEYWKHWPDHPEGLLRACLRAAVADLRYVQGFLLEWHEDDSYPSSHDAHLASVGRTIAAKIGKQADRLEKELGSWRG